MDFLEKKVRQQRDEFDSIERVDEGMLWLNIQSSLPQNQITKAPPAKVRSLNFWKIYAVAASFTMLIMAGWIISHNQIIDGGKIVAEVVVPLELKAKEKDLQQLVAEKEESLNFENIDRASFADVFSELELLEAMHQEFKNELPEVSDHEKAIKVLQKHYDRKIRILERLSKEIEKKTYDDEKRINEKPM